MFALSAWILQPALEPVRPAGLRAVCARIVWPVLFASHVPGVLCGHVQRVAPLIADGRVLQVRRIVA